MFWDGKCLDGKCFCFSVVVWFVIVTWKSYPELDLYKVVLFLYIFPQRIQNIA